MAESFPPQIFNHDVVWLYDLLRRFHTEMSRSQSAPVSGMIVPDQERLQSYLNTMRLAVTWIQAAPLLDLPETHPRPYTLEPFPAEMNVENEEINVILRLLRGTAVEMTNSQSARYSSRLQPFDEKRLVAIVDKIDQFLNTFIKNAKAVPLDLPESTPEAAMPPQGSMGVLGPSANN